MYGLKLKLLVDLIVKHHDDVFKELDNWNPYARKLLGSVRLEVGKIATDTLGYYTLGLNKITINRRYYYRGYREQILKEVVKTTYHEVLHIWIPADDAFFLEYEKRFDPSIFNTVQYQLLAKELGFFLARM
jgi:hypothetical protein